MRGHRANYKSSRRLRLTLKETQVQRPLAFVDSHFPLVAFEVVLHVASLQRRALATSWFSPCVGGNQAEGQRLPVTFL